MAARPYAQALARGDRRPVRRSWPSASRCCASRHARQGRPGRAAVLLLTSNRGLAGGFNANLIKEAARAGRRRSRAGGYAVDLHVVGKKGIGYFRYVGRTLALQRTRHRRQADGGARRRAGGAADGAIRGGRARPRSRSCARSSSQRSRRRRRSCACCPSRRRQAPAGRGKARFHPLARRRRDPRAAAAALRAEPGVPRAGRDRRRRARRAAHCDEERDRQRGRDARRSCAGRTTGRARRRSRRRSPKSSAAPRHCRDERTRRLRRARRWIESRLPAPPAQRHSNRNTDKESSMATATVAQQIGKIVQVIGPVLDVEFEPEQLPEIYNALRGRGLDRGRHPVHAGGRSAAAHRPQPGARGGDELAPTAWCAAWTRSTPGGAITVPVGDARARPDPQRAGRAGGRRRADSGRRRALADPPQARRSSWTSSPRPRSSRPASRSST